MIKELLMVLFAVILKPQIGAKLFSKKLFVKLYTTNSQTKDLSFWGKKFQKLTVKTHTSGEISISLGYCSLLGEVRKETFHITYMGSSDDSITGSRNVIRVIDYLVNTYKSIDPGSMSIYSARLYWSCIRRKK